MSTTLCGLLSQTTVRVAHPSDRRSLSASDHLILYTMYPRFA